jgi:two-component system sensor histidine kinase CiaH
MPVNTKKLQLTNIVFWVLLLYIIAALVWWYFSLYTQNEEIYKLQVENISNSQVESSPSTLHQQLEKIQDTRQRNRAKYIGEGGTFFILILVGAAYIYRSVRQQFRTQQQQQNFVMAVTHELKTPISVSKLNLETLQRHTLDEPRKEKLLHMTLQEMMRLDSLINNIIISSQLDGHSYHLSKEELNFSDLVTDVIHQFAGRYAERKLQPGIEADIDITGDPTLLKLLVSNLLENANKYSPRDKPIRIRLTEHSGKVRLEVEDEGEGISDEEKKNVFKKFYRVGNEQTRKTKGTGLGLYLCKKIAEDHSGSITIEDNRSQGSNFIVSFPS